MEENKKEEFKQLLQKSASSDHFKEHKKDRNIEKPQTETFNKEKLKEDITTEKKSLDVNILLSSLVVIILFIVCYLLINQNNQINKLQEKLAVIKTEPTVKKEIIVEEKEIIKEIKVIDEKLTKETFQEFYNSRKFEKFTCYDYNAGAIQPSKKCLDNLHNFLEKNKNAIRLEIIPVVSNEDKKLFDGIEEIELENYSTPQRLTKYALRGLSRDRVLELTWNIKQISGINLVLTPTNYYVESSKNNKGVLIKAYY